MNVVVRLWEKMGESAEGVLGDVFDVRDAGGASGAGRAMGVSVGALGFECVVGPAETLAADVVLSRREATAAPDLSALAALASCRLVAAVLDADAGRLAELPLPRMPRQVEAQLAVLWRRFEACGEAERAQLVGSFDRIGAELYDSTLDDLMDLQLHLNP